jgi:hypothetical protein
MLATAAGTALLLDKPLPFLEDVKAEAARLRATFGIICVASHGAEVTGDLFSDDNLAIVAITFAPESRSTCPTWESQ